MNGYKKVFDTTPVFVYTDNRQSRVISSVGRAPALQAGCRRFEPVIAHQTRCSKFEARGSKEPWSLSLDYKGKRTVSYFEHRTSNLDHGPVV